MMRSVVLMQGTLFGSTVVITIEMTEKPGLTNGEAIRVVDDIADVVLAAVKNTVNEEAKPYQPGKNIRWESYESTIVETCGESLWGKDK